jgi:p24 family protein beta-1
MFWLLLVPFLGLARVFDRPPEMVHPGTPVDLSAEEESMELMKEWDEKMQGFVPEDMMTFEIGGRAEEEFYENVDVVPSSIRGAWFLASDNSKDIDFVILDPLQNVVFQKQGKKEAVFQVEAKRQGIYVFKFTNNRVMMGHTITFTFNSGNSTNTVQKSIKDFQVDNQFAQLRQETHFKTVASANKNVFWFSMVESFGVIAVTAWQVFYIKKLLDNRRVL